MPRPDRADDRAGDRAPLAALLLHPVFLLALAAWLLNDHIGKHHWGGAVTGKLSDAASLVYFPLLAAAAHDALAVRLGLRRAGVRTVASWALAAAAVMAAINLLDGAAWLYCHGLGLAQWPVRCAEAVLLAAPVPPPRPVRLTMDPTDLVTLPAALVAVALAARQLRGELRAHSMSNPWLPPKFESNR